MFIVPERDQREQNGQRKGKANFGDSYPIDRKKNGCGGDMEENGGTVGALVLGGGGGGE